MNLEILENQIEKTEYWDMSILDIQIQYFGDEVHLFIENNEKTCWKISFVSCYKVNYETDANWRGSFRVKDMRGGQLGYYGQDISVKQYEENEDFIESILDLSIMTMDIVCKDISVEEVQMEDTSFFWQDEKND